MLGGWVAFKFKVDSPGVYSGEFFYMEQKNYGAGIGVYIAPYQENMSSEDIQQLFVQENRYCHVDTRQSPGGKVVSTDLENVTFINSGEYLLVFRGDSGTERASNMYLNQVVFTQVEKLEPPEEPPEEVPPSGVKIDYDFRFGAYQEDVANSLGDNMRNYTSYGASQRQWAYVNDTVAHQPVGSEQAIQLLKNYTQIFTDLNPEN
jgi:hypothetical protein